MNYQNIGDFEVGIKQSKIRGEKKEVLKKAYLLIFDYFSLDTKEIASAIGLSTADTYKLLKSCSLITGSLIVNGCSGGEVTRKNNPGIPYMWQCWKTHDLISHSEAEKLFDSIYN